MDDLGRVYLKHNFQNAKNIWPPLDHKPGAGEFDQVWEDVDGKIYMIEAKSGESTLGSRVVKNNIKIADRGVRVEQGTEPYFEDIIEEMKTKGGAAQETANKIQKAYNGDNATYSEIRQGFDDNGNLKPVEKRDFDLK